MQSPAGRDPASGLESRSSIHHCAAVALADGAAGVAQFQDERVHHPRLAQLRARVDTIADASLGPDEAHIQVALRDGRSVAHHVRCALGSPQRPMTDADLSDKFRTLATEVLATDQAERLLALAWNVRALVDVGALVRASVPDEEIEPAELPGSPLIPR
jgi:2-methylcitrate dehydratase PrpD